MFEVDIKNVMDKLNGMNQNGIENRMAWFNA